MLNNCNFKKHAIMSIIFSSAICLLSYIIINPSNSAIIGLILTSGNDLSINIGMVHIILVTSITLLLSLLSYKIIRK